MGRTGRRERERLANTELTGLGLMSRGPRRRRSFVVATIATGVALVTGAVAIPVLGQSGDDKIDPPLRTQLGASGTISVAVLLERQLLLGPAALDDFAHRNANRNRSALRREVTAALKAAAERDQAVVLEALGEPAGARPLWIANALFVDLTPEQVRTAASHERVRRIYLMPGAPPSYASPGRVGDVLEAGDRPPFSVEDKRVPWNVERIGAARVWRELGVTGEGALVAMIDNGTNYTHPELRRNVWTNRGEVANNGIDDDANGLIDDVYGFDFARGRAEVQRNPSLGPGAGHGTWTSGIVVGDGSGGVVTGLAPRARLMISIVGGRTYAMGRALEYAIEHGADVATMSFSLPGLGNVRGLWRLMADHATAAGLVLVSGAGNFQQSAPSGVQQRIPEGIPSVVSVGGVDRSLELLPYSSLGPVSWSSVALYEDHPSLTKPDVAAFPGPDFPLIRAGGAGYLDPGGRQGNSFSGPHAAGVAALVLSANAELPAWEVKRILESTARDLPPEGRDNRTGAGLLDAFAAVREAIRRR